MRQSICLFLCLLCTGVGAQPAYILHKPYADKYLYIDSLWENDYFHQSKNIEDSIPKLEKWAMANNDPELADMLLLFQYSVLPTTDGVKRNPEFETALNGLLADAKKNKTDYLLADINEELGDYFWNVRNKYGISLEYYMAAYQIYSKIPPDKFPGKQRYLYELGNLYYSYEDFDIAIKYLKEALVTKSYYERWFYPLNNTLGLSYMKLGNYDSSEFYFNNIYNNALKNNDTSWISISTGNIGVSFFHQGRYSEAIPMLEKDIDLSSTHHMAKNAASSACILAEIYNKQGKYTLAEEILLKALNGVESRTFWPDYQLASHLFTQLHNVYEGLGDYKKSAVYADSALQMKDSLASQIKGLSLAKAQEKIDFARHQLEVGTLTSEKKIQELISLTLIAGIATLSFIGILLVNRQRIKNKVLLNEKKLLEAERDSAAKQLNDFTQNVQEKSILIEQFAQEIERYKKNEEVDADNETLLQLERSIILTDEQWENFRLLFEKVHKGFFNRVKEKMPDLTPAEIRFVALSKLKLSPKEMAAMLGISANSIRNYRLRLRRKLGLGEEASIEEIADAI